VAFVVADKERELEPYAVALVAGAAVLVRFGCVPPAFRREQLDDAFVILEPDGDVDVVVFARDPAGVEVDGPAAEEPVLDSARCQRVVDAVKCR
jgi:hypothetical protein